MKIEPTDKFINILGINCPEILIYYNGVDETGEGDYRFSTSKSSRSCLWNTVDIEKYFIKLTPLTEILYLWK